MLKSLFNHIKNYFEYKVNDPEFYNLLEIEPNATRVEIVHQFRQCAIHMHPDKGGNEQHFQKVTEAYNVLANSITRRLYDVEGLDGIKHAGAKLTFAAANWKRLRYFLHDNQNYFRWLNIVLVFLAAFCLTQILCSSWGIHTQLKDFDCLPVSTIMEDTILNGLMFGPFWSSWAWASIAPQKYSSSNKTADQTNPSQDFHSTHNSEYTGWIKIIENSGSPQNFPFGGFERKIAFWTVIHFAGGRRESDTKNVYAHDINTDDADQMNPTVSESNEPSQNEEDEKIEMTVTALRRLEELLRRKFKKRKEIDEIDREVEQLLTSTTGIKYGL